jgi:hypothetical protein
MSYGGLRGAVAFYLSLNINTEYKHLVIMTTICLIMFTIIGLGSTTTCLLQYLDRKFPEDEIIQKEEEEEGLSDGFRNFDDNQGDSNKPAATMFEHIDQKYGQKMFRRTEVPGEEKEIKLDLELDDEEHSETSLTAERGREQLEAYFNRRDRAGDMSPGRTLDIKFKGRKKKDSIFGKYAGLGETPSMRNTMKDRKYSQGIENRRSERPMETPKFAYTTKNRRGTSGGTFGELLKSRSEDTKDVALSPTHEYKDVKLPKLTFEEHIISEAGDEEERDSENPSRKKDKSKASEDDKNSDDNDDKSPNSIPFDRAKPQQFVISDLYEKKPKEEAPKKLAMRNNQTFGEPVYLSNKEINLNINDIKDPLKEEYSDLLSPDLVEVRPKVEQCKSSNIEEDRLPMTEGKKIEREFSFNKQL